MRTIQILLIAMIMMAAIVGSVAFRSKLAYRLLGMFFFSRGDPVCIIPRFDH